VSAGVGGGLALALCSAAALNWGYFAQHGAAAALPPLSLRRPLRSLWALFSNRRWFTGFAGGIGGWVLYVAALALAPLSLVQAASAAGISVLALLVRRSAGLSRREAAGVGASAGALVLLGVSLAGGAAAGAHGDATAVAVWIGASAVVSALAVGAGSASAAAGVGLGAAAGILYAAGDVGTKGAVGGGASLAFVPAVLACHGLAFVLLQLSFQRGGALATAGVATLLTNSLPIVAGTTVFGESVPHGALGAARFAAFAGAVAGAALLAREAAPAPAPPAPVAPGYD
jgi:hypothetical protein